MKKLNWFLINENYGANLCPYAFHFDADYHGFKKAYGVGINYQAIGIENGFLRQAYDLDEYNRMAFFFYNKLCKDKKFAHKSLENIYKTVKEFYDFNKCVLKTPLNKLSDKQLARLFDKFYQYFFNMSTWSVPFAFTEHGTSLWTDSLTKYLNTLDIPLKYTSLEVYQTLISSKKKTYIAKEKEGLLKIAVKIKRSKKLLKTFKMPVSSIVSFLEKDEKDILKEIKRHVKKYNWINYGFEGPLLNLEYFITAIKDWVVNKDSVKELTQIKNNLKTLESKQKKFIKNLKIDKIHQWMFWVVKEFGFQKAYRKDFEYHSYYVYEILLKELSRRLQLSVKQGHYLLKNEIVAALLKKKKINIDQLNKRIKCNFYVIIKGKPNLLVGKRAKTFIKQIGSLPVPKGLKELKGQCACHGRVIGKAKIIKNKEDYQKFKTNDILVSYATNPNMVPLMKKSSAIITDEGGVTCHAAIVSRELGIPCIIGTRFATKIIKDNNLVEVDATRGIIKILKKK